MDFENHVYTLLGGLEMAVEFFDNHHNAWLLMLDAARSEPKMPADVQARLFFIRHIQPRLRRDRIRAKGIDSYLDPRN